MRTTTRHLVLASMLVPLAAWMGGGQVARGDEEQRHEAWMRIEIGGKHAGRTHTVTRQAEDGSGDIVTTSRTEMRMGRLGAMVEVSTSTVSRETKDGVLLRIDSTSKQSSVEQSASYEFSRGVAKATVQVLGQKRTVDIPVPEGLLGPARMERDTRTLAGTNGEKRAFLTFSPDFQAPTDFVFTSHGKEQVLDHEGRSVEGTRIESRLTTTQGVAIPLAPVVWVDEGGLAIRTVVEVAGMRIEMLTVPTEADAKAKRSSGPATGPDVFAATLLRENDWIPVPRHLEAAKLVVGTTGDRSALPTFSSAGHVAVAQDDGTLLVTATRRVPPADGGGIRPLGDPPAELKDALAPNSMIQSDHADLIAVARQVVGDETSAWKAAQALERHVSAHIAKKSMSVASASALETLRSAEGDCTEHATLLAALGRAAGIPTRVVMGLLFLHGVWGGHAWNEVWIDGAWYPLDGTTGYGFVDPLHLPLGHLTMKDGGAAEWASLLASLGRLTIDIVEVTHGGQTIRVDDPALITSDAGGWRNRALEISFQKPPGLFEFTPPSRKEGISPRVMDLVANGVRARMTISIDYMDVPAEADWTSVLGAAGFDSETAETIGVDGRDARRVRLTRAAKSREIVVARSGQAMWIFSIESEGPKGKEVADDAFAFFLEHVDFDVR